MSSSGLTPNSQLTGQNAVDTTRNQLLAQIAKALFLLTPSTGGGALVLGIRTVSDSEPVGTDDYALRCDATAAAITITLPAVASSLGRILAFKKIDSTGNQVTITGDAYIDGSPTLSLPFSNQSVTVQSNGTVWSIF